MRISRIIDGVEWTDSQPDQKDFACTPAIVLRDGVLYQRWDPLKFETKGLWVRVQDLGPFQDVPIL